MEKFNYRRLIEKTVAFIQAENLCPTSEHREAITDFIKQTEPYYTSRDSLHDFQFRAGTHFDQADAIALDELKQVDRRTYFDLMAYADPERLVTSVVRFIAGRLVDGEITWDDVYHHIETSVMMSGWITLSCQECGAPITFCLDMENKLAKQETGDLLTPLDCPNYQKGYEPISVNFPSGKIVIANDLRGLIEAEEGRRLTDIEHDYAKQHGMTYFSLNNRHGLHMHTKFMLEYGLVYLYTSRSPSVYMNEEGIIGASSMEYYEEVLFDEEGNLLADKVGSSRHNTYLQVRDMKEISSMSTDLWAVNMMDYDRFSTLCESQGMSSDEGLAKFSAFVVDAPAAELVIPAETFSKEVSNDEDREVQFRLQVVPSPKPAMAM